MLDFESIIVAAKIVELSAEKREVIINEILKMIHARDDETRGKNKL